MATLKEFLEERMMDTTLLNRVCVKEACLDTKERRHLKIRTKKLESDNEVDIHECIITVTSDVELVPLITVRNIVKLLRLIEEPCGCYSETPYHHVIRVIDHGHVLSEDNKQMDITFHVISNIEKKIK